MLKKAILVGFGYKRTQYNLVGPPYDLKNMVKFLTTKMGYAIRDITVYSDALIQGLNVNVLRPYSATGLSNKNIILSKLTETINLLKASQNSSLWFYFSGHGSEWYYNNGKYTQPLTGVPEESNNADQILCTYDMFKPSGDFDYSKPIYDNELQQILKTIPVTCKFYAIVDSCHSGTACDLPYRWTDEAGALDFFKDKFDETLFPNKNLVVISGCKDNQTSADMGVIGGLLTYTFLQLFRLTKYANLSNINIVEFLYDLSKNVRNIEATQFVTATSSIKLENTRKLFDTSLFARNMSSVRDLYPLKLSMPIVENGTVRNFYINDDKYLNKTDVKSNNRVVLIKKK